MKKVAGIYKITSPSGRVYIGQSWEINERFGNYRRRECHRQRRLHYSLQKYGVDAHVFTVLHEVLPNDTSQEEMNRLERWYMDAYRRKGVDLLNCKEGGSNGRLSPETRRLVSEGLRGNIPWNKGLRGLRKHSEETKRKMSGAAKGRKPNNHGKPRSQSAIERTRASNAGRARTDEQRARIRAGIAARSPERAAEINRKISEAIKRTYAERRAGVGR